MTLRAALAWQLHTEERIDVGFIPKLREACGT
jgi:hypothetical protein